MTSTLKVYSVTATGLHGLQYNVRLLLDAEELKGLQAAGLIPDAMEVIGMQDVADATVAAFEKQAFTACGGVIQ